MPGSRSASDEPSIRQLGSYRLVRQLGTGGMSSVFEAIHQEAGSRVAVKVLPRNLAQNPVLLQRFLREAKSAESLDHPHIVAIFDRGYDQGRHYLVLEYVEGNDLADRVRNDGPMTADEALAFARQVATGLQYAASRGMIHRDIKPANLLLTPAGFAKIIDLGLALQAADEDERVTRDGTTVGTVDYMSPEQARDSRKITERSDIYSLGCTLHYLVTGSPPFPGGTLADKLARHHGGPIPDARALVPATPAHFVELVQRMMAKKPEDRFQNYQELIDAIDRVEAPGLLTAIPIDDDLEDEDDAVELTLAEPPSGPPPRALARPGRPPTPAESDPAGSGQPIFSLAELAALEPERAKPGRQIRRPDAEHQERTSGVDLVDLFEEDVDEDEVRPLGRRGDEIPLQTWIAAGIGVGLILAVLAFGVAFLFSSARPQPDPVLGIRQQAADDAATPETVEAPERPSAPPPVGPVRNDPPPKKSTIVGGPPAEAPRGVSPAITQSIPAMTAAVYPDSLLDRLGMRRPAVASRDGVGKVSVRRIPDGDDPTGVVSLAVALGRPNEDVEIADAGPIHEDDFTIAGRSRVIRAKAGVRPIVKIEFARQQMVRDQPAKFLLGGTGVERLTIEGLDLVVDVRDLPLTQSTLFQCDGMDLTIRDCTLTVEHAEDRRSGYSIFRLVESSRPNRVAIERSLIRGPIQSLVEIEGGRAELSLDRSVVLGANLSMIQVKSAGAAGESIRFSESVLVGRAPILRVADRSARLAVRSLGSAFAHVEGAPAEPWIAGAVGQLDYDGEGNRWFGWTSLAGSKPGVVPARLLDELHRLSPVADRTSLDRPESWSSSLVEGRMTAAACRAEVPDRQAMLDQVAVPRPYLHELTVDLFPRPLVPDQAPNLGGWAANDPRPLVSLAYDPAVPGDEDFGVYLARMIKDSKSRYQVQVPSVGARPMSPTRLPDESALAIIGPPGQGSQQPIPTFFPAQPGEALIAIRRGSLSIANVGLTNDNRFRTGCGLLVEDGLLVLSRFLYRDLSPASEDGAAIRFRSRPAEQPTPILGGLMAAVGQPTLSVANSWIWSNANGIEAEVDRGILKLENCVLNSGKSGIELRPASPSRLDASLLLENCTVVAERFAVAQGPGLGRAGGGGRPWLVISRACVFPRPWRDTSTLLGVDPEGFAAGSLFWQSSNDIYDVGRFVAGVRAATPPSHGADLKRQWTDLWGMNHTRGDRGPDARKLERILVFRDKDRSRTSRPTLAQLELDPEVKPLKGVGADFSRLPPTPR